MGWKKCYKCRWHTDKCKNTESKNFNKFPHEVSNCNEPIKFQEKTNYGITKQVNNTRKEHICYFCGRTISSNSSCLVTIDFANHKVKYSCMDCYAGIIYLYGD